ncbi:hypothetical protein [Limnoglobus roseus]|uniref:AraC family transcriptional regulator n=1 Tax=Limnoglobus roseus TaxID=2598579 RepID=A0A5C1ABE0_9BACT|nr:hypothetical protein [Limnoglobus roseus]QEL15895.1 hypothetical protein PX52LOC_02831 [Limnoglobus roseus]
MPRRYVIARVAALGPAALPAACFLRADLADGYAWDHDLGTAWRFPSFAAALAVVVRYDLMDAWEVEVRFALTPEQERARATPPADLRAAAAAVLAHPAYADRRAWSLRRLAAEVLHCDPSWLSRVAREITGAAPDAGKAAAARLSRGRSRQTTVEELT